MYINKETGDKVSVEDMQKYAEENGVSVEQYARDFNYILEEQSGAPTSNATKDPESRVKDGDLLDPNFQQGAAADAGVVQPMTASKNTELAPVDTSSDSQEDNKITLEQFKSMSADEKKALSYSDKQRLPRELYKEKNNILDEIESEASKKLSLIHI